MMESSLLVSAESNAQFIAFRRFVYHFSRQLSLEEKQVLVYVRLYKHKEQYKDVATLEVLARLEADGVFSSSSPEGLAELARDVQRQDLVTEVKDFIKKRNKKSLSGSSKRPKSLSYESNTGLMEEDLQLKATFEVTLAKATVLMQQVESLEHALIGGKDQRQKAEQAIREASQTATALAEHLKRAQVDLGISDDSHYQEKESAHRPDRYSPLGRPALSHGNVYAQSHASTMPQPVSRHAPPQLMNRHSLPVMHSSPALQSPSKNFHPTSEHRPFRSKLPSSNSPEVLKEEEEEEEDDYEKMYPAQLNLESINGSINPPSSILSYMGRTSPSGTSMHPRSVGSYYNSQDFVNRQQTSQAYQNVSCRSGTSVGSVPHDVQVLRGVQQSIVSETSVSSNDRGARTNTVKSERQSRAAGPGGAVHERDASSDGVKPVKPPRRKAPVAPPRRHSQTQASSSSSYGYVDSTTQQTRVPTVVNDASGAADDGYTTLHPLGDSKAARETSDGGLTQLQQLRKFISTDPVLKESGHAGKLNAHYYKHLQRDDENAKDDPYTALNYGYQDSS